MCGIAGIKTKDGTDAISLLGDMLDSIRHRGPDGAGVVASGSILRASSLEKLDLNQLHGDSVMGHTRLAVVGGHDGQQPFTSDDGKLVLLHNGEIYNYKKLRKSLKRTHKFNTSTDSEVLVHLLDENYDGDLFKAVNTIIPLLDGVYAIAATDGKDIVIARDLIGVRQLYWAEDDRLFAFASEKKALWRIGLMEDIHRLRPGEVICFSTGGIEAKRRSPEHLRPVRPTIHDIDEALAKYKSVLEESVRKRIPEQDKVGMIFSGGIDSVLIAVILKQMGVNLTCYVAGTEGSTDIAYARKVAEQMNIPLCVNSLSNEALQELIPKAITFIEDRSLGQIEVAIPILASVEMAHEDEQIVLFTGQGADELFGGYPWYRRIIELDGYDEFDFRMWDDLKHLYNETLEREDKIAMAYGIEMRVPYLDPAVIKAAFAMDPLLKIRSAKDVTGKYIHRMLASQIGLPDDIAWRPKEAAQHGAGIHYRFLALAEAKGFDNKLVEDIRYTLADSQEEVLGSSQRYGFKYDKASRWATQDYVQLWLDHIAYEKNLLNPGDRERLEPYFEQAGKIKIALKS